MSTMDAPHGGYGQPWLQPLTGASTPQPSGYDNHHQQHPRATSSSCTQQQQVLKSYVGTASPLLRSASTGPSFSPPTLLGHAAEDSGEDVLKRGVWPPPSLKPQEIPNSRDSWDELNVKKSKTPNLNYLVANGALLNRPYCRTPARVELRQRVLSGTPTIRVPRDSTHMEAIRAKDALRQFTAPHPAAIEASLNEDLACIDATDNYRRLHAHRVALERFIAIQSPTAQSLLKRVLACYEEVELHQFSQHFDEVTKRFQASEAVARDALTERNALRHHAESLRLDIVNLERQLHAKEEMLAEVAASHRINVNAVNWMTGGTNSNAPGGAGEGGGSGAGNGRSYGRSMAEIRSIQERVATRHGESQRQAAKEEAMAASTADHSMMRRSVAGGEIGSINGGSGSVTWVDAAAERQAQQDMSDADALVSGGLSTLHGHAPSPGNKEQQQQLQGGDLSELYIHAQRTDNLGTVLSPASMPMDTLTHLPGESPRVAAGGALSLLSSRRSVSNI